MRKTKKQEQIERAKRLFKEEKDKYSDVPEDLYKKVKKRTQLSKQVLLEIARPILGNLEELV
jgi:hypothetical protein